VFITFCLYTFAKNLSYLKEKSKFNLDAAKELIDVYSYYAPSVHCTYYGVFQYINTTLNKLGHTYSQITTEMNQAKLNGRPFNTHDYPVKLILEKLRNCDIIYKNDIRDKLKDLKTFRRISDYENIEVKYEDGKKALSLGNEIIDLLKTKLP
jgi:hypothetical protein